MGSAWPAPEGGGRGDFVPLVRCFGVTCESGHDVQTTNSAIDAARSRRPVEYGLGAHVLVAALVGERREAQEHWCLRVEFVSGGAPESDVVDNGRDHATSVVGQGRTTLLSILTSTFAYTAVVSEEV